MSSESGLFLVILLTSDVVVDWLAVRVIDSLALIDPLAKDVDLGGEVVDLG